MKSNYREHLRIKEKAKWKGKKQPQEDILNTEKRLLKTNDQQEMENTKSSQNEKKYELNGIIDHTIYGILIR